jgi:hypothetical protein
MSSHSEEIWGSFDALWRRVQTLGRQVKELEARLAMLEAPAAGNSGVDFKAVSASEEIKLTSALQRRD